MPVFMIISGHFAKGRIDRNDWIGAFNKLIIPYIVIQLFMVLFYAITNYSKITLGTIIKPGYGLWYIFVLGIYQIITPLLFKIFRHKWTLLPASLILMLLYLYFAPVLPPPIARIVNFLPFFIFGYLTSKLDFNLLKKPLFRLMSVLVLVILFVFITQDNILQVVYLSGKRVFREYNEWLGVGKFDLLIITIVRYLAGFISFFFIMGISPVKKTIFTKLGTRSTFVYILHLFIIVMLTAYDKQYGILDFCRNEIFAFAIILLAIPASFIITSSPVRKYTKWLVTPNFDLRKIVRKISK